MVLSQAEQLKFIEDIKQGKIQVIDPTRGGVLANYSMYKLPNEEGTTNSTPTNSAPPTDPVISYPTVSYPNQSGYRDSNQQTRNPKNSNRYTLISQQYLPSIDNSNYLYIVGGLVISYFLFNRK